MLLGALNWSQTWYRSGHDAPETIARQFVGLLRILYSPGLLTGHLLQCLVPLGRGLLGLVDYHAGLWSGALRLPQLVGHLQALAGLQLLSSFRHALLQLLLGLLGTLE